MAPGPMAPDPATDAPAAVRVGRFTVQRAAAADEAGMRALLRVPMEGEVRLSLEREPDCRHAAGIEGDTHHAVVVRDGQGRVVGMGSRAVRDVWLHGAPARIGYLAQMRHQGMTGAAGPLMRAGYAVFAATRAAGELPWDLTSIAADNGRARRLLERGLPGVPPYRPLAELVTCLVPTRTPWPWRRGVRGRALPEVHPARERMAEVVACLARNHARYALAPVWTEADLASPERCRGLAEGGVWTVAGNGGAVRGCAALWDQRAFKQMRVAGYSPRLARLRPVLNPLLRLRGWPPLPAAGSTLSMAFLSHVAVDGDDKGAFLALLRQARSAAAAKGIRWLVTAFVEGHPLLAALRQAVQPRTYRTVLYAVEWEPDAARGVDGRRLHVEVATL